MLRRSTLAVLASVTSPVYVLQESGALIEVARSDFAALPEAPGGQAVVLLSVRETEEGPSFTWEFRPIAECLPS